MTTSRSAVRFAAAVGEVLHLVIDGDGEGAGGAGDISADHEHHAEFTDGVRETEQSSRAYGTRGEREQHGTQHVSTAMRRANELVRRASMSTAEKPATIGCTAKGRL